MTPPDATIIEAVRAAVPGLEAVYLFGSRAHGEERADSDLDLAVLLPGRADVVRLWETAQDLAIRFGIDVDLVDLRSASTVLQYQIVTKGRRLFAVTGATVGLFELLVGREITDLNQRRAALIGEIEREGRVYGR